MEDRVADLEGEVGAFEKNIAGHKTQLQGLLREIEKLKSEKHETVAEMLTAKEEKEIADMLAGISQDRTSEETSRASRPSGPGQSDCSEFPEKWLASMPSSRRKSSSNTHPNRLPIANFEKLIGLTKESGEADSGSQERTQIPES